MFSSRDGQNFDQIFKNGDVINVKSDIVGPRFFDINIDVHMTCDAEVALFYEGGQVNNVPFRLEVTRQPIVRTVFSRGCQRKVNYLKL